MLHFGLVLLFATSALAAPSTTLLTTVPISEYQAPPGNGRPINSRVIDLFFSIVDGGDSTVYREAAYNVVKDLANLGDTNSQALAAAYAIGMIGEEIPGSAGDSCEAAALINAAGSGNRNLIRSALGRYLPRVFTNIDFIVQLNSGNENVRFATGPRSNCANGGRVYDFEGVWSSLLNNVSPYQIELVNEQYCAARRLYNGLSDKSNNIGAALTAASTAPIIQIFQECLPPVARFMRVVAEGGNTSGAAQSLKAALSAAASRY